MSNYSNITRQRPVAGYSHAAHERKISYRKQVLDWSKLLLSIPLPSTTIALLDEVESKETIFWLKNGVPATNLHVFNRDAEVVRAIAKKKLGVNIYHTDIADCDELIGSRPDIIHYDGCSPLGSRSAREYLTYLPTLVRDGGLFFFNASASSHVSELLDKFKELDLGGRDWKSKTHSDVYCMEMKRWLRKQWADAAVKDSGRDVRQATEWFQYARPSGQPMLAKGYMVS